MTPFAVRLGQMIRFICGARPKMGRVVCTFDDDFLKLAADVTHAGIIKGVQGSHSIGDWVRFLRFVDALSNADEMRNRVTHLFRVYRYAPED